MYHSSPAAPSNKIDIQYLNKKITIEYIRNELNPKVLLVSNNLTFTSDKTVNNLLNQNYKYYWFFDDDVTFSGDLKKLLNDYELYADDFVAIQAFKKEAYPELSRVSVVSDKMKGSGGRWLDYAPGAGDNYKSVYRHLGSFFPVVRFSNKALEHLNNLNKEGFFGYSEGFVPTALASDGFYVSSMLDDNDKYFIKTNSNCIIRHKGATFTWSWI